MPHDDPKEQFEVFDDHGKLVGLVARSVVHAQGLWHRSVYVFVYNQENKLLLQRRAFNKDVCPGRWDLSCGEHLIPNEDFEQAAVRGVSEELGITIAQTDLIALGTLGRYEYLDDAKGIHDREMHRCFAVQWDGALSIDVSEVDRTRWVSQHELHDDVSAEADRYTPWLVHLLKQLPPTSVWRHAR